MADEEAKEDKSIVDPKYRERYKTPDWLGQLIANYAGTTKEVTKTQTVTNKKGEEVKKQVTEKVPGPIDVDKLFELAEENGLADKVEKYKKQRDVNGFAGRFRMTLRNMLQARIKRSHGFFINGKWKKADAEWLEAKGAPEAPTHTRTGEKIAKKPAKKETADA